MKSYPATILCLALFVWATSANALPMGITEGTYTPANGDPYSITGKIDWFADETFAQMFSMASADIFVDGFDPIRFGEWSYFEIQGVFEDHYPFVTVGGAPDPLGRFLNGYGTAFYEAEIYQSYGGGPSDFVRGLAFQSVQMHIDVLSAEDQSLAYSLDLFAEATPVPEPATIMLLACGLVGLAGMRKKTHRGKQIASSSVP